MPVFHLTNGTTATVGTTQLYPIGFEFEDHSQTAVLKDYGPRVWRYVQIVTTGVVAGNIVQRSASATQMNGVRYSFVADLHQFQILGAAQHTIAVGEFGWILKRGPGSYLADGTGATAGQSLFASPSVDGAVRGRAITTITDSDVLGYAITAATSAVGIGMFLLN